uniref:Uncharacterized protein n=1 Tax=Palpitomonas bilix TaxID=652834 RepID=A0A7S3DHH5_9EUKA|mmetsp:Transcript_38131/g.98464  ORF Transcript_38131/g.98464 Transcript_38131/m.98464 type:complete len:368 (+) Transcript_38131:161-1264(+)
MSSTRSTAPPFYAAFADETGFQKCYAWEDEHLENCFNIRSLIAATEIGVLPLDISSPRSRSSPPSSRDSPSSCSSPVRDLEFDGGVLRPLRHEEGLESRPVMLDWSMLDKKAEEVALELQREVSISEKVPRVRGKVETALANEEATVRGADRLEVTSQEGDQVYSLRHLWARLDDASAYGLEVPVHTRGGATDAYFVPSLSAARLFKKGDGERPSFEFASKEEPGRRGPIVDQIHCLSCLHPALSGITSDEIDEERSWVALQWTGIPVGHHLEPLSKGSVLLYYRFGCEKSTGESDSHFSPLRLSCVGFLPFHLNFDFWFPRGRSTLASSYGVPLALVQQAITLSLELPYYGDYAFATWGTNLEQLC